MTNKEMKRFLDQIYQEITSRFKEDAILQTINVEEHPDINEIEAKIKITPRDGKDVDVVWTTVMKLDAP